MSGVTPETFDIDYVGCYFGLGFRGFTGTLSRS